MDKIYVAVDHDRHKDPELYACTTPEAAIDWARNTAIDKATIKLVEDQSSDWLYLTIYSNEDDYVYVQECEIHT